jgi:hypothetical protein
VNSQRPTQAQIWKLTQDKEELTRSMKRNKKEQMEAMMSEEKLMGVMNMRRS